MSLNVRNPKAEQFAAELARQTGESKTEAVTKALRERLIRVRHERTNKRLADELEEIAETLREPARARSETGGRDAGRVAVTFCCRSHCEDGCLRQRLERKLRKQVRLLRHRYPDLAADVDRSERSALSFREALLRMMQDVSLGGVRRGTIARILAVTDREEALRLLLDQFFAQENTQELWDTALTLQTFNDPDAVGPLVRALRYDANPHRRHAAARALGWISNAGTQAAHALIDALLDRSQPPYVREEAAESLAYCPYAWVIPPLLSVLDEPDVRVRFFVVFALGTRRPSYGSYRREAGVIEALERMLSDEAVPPGNWWSISREALAMLANLDTEYRARSVAEIERIVADPEASPEDRRWAEFYDPLPAS